MATVPAANQYFNRKGREERKGNHGTKPRMTRVARIVIVWLSVMYYHSLMAKAKKFEFENPLPAVDDEDEQTLAAIDEGIQDAENGRVVPAEEVRKLLPKWITESSTRKKR